MCTYNDLSGSRNRFAPLKFPFLKGWKKFWTDPLNSLPPGSIDGGGEGVVYVQLVKPGGTGPVPQIFLFPMSVDLDHLLFKEVERR